jgi:phospholipid/cholesterol/gamma-HCH transport system ATP-binding protein
VLVADHEARGAPLVDLASLTDEEMDRIRRHWAVVFQKNALYTGTVYENIALGLIDVKGLSESEALERSRKMLASVGLEPDRVLKLDRDELSGGMAKRVAVARALAMDPYLMFYDEPTTGLDPELGKKIQDLIFDVHVSSPKPGVERTSIIVTHDMTLLGRLEPRVVMLHDGRIVFDGTSAAFRETKCDVAQPYIEVMPVLHRGSHRQLSGSNSEFADDDTFTRKG